MTVTILGLLFVRQREGNKMFIIMNLINLNIHEYVYNNKLIALDKT